MTIEEPISDMIKESIKLEKNTKGYNWSIRITPINGTALSEEDLKRLEGLNDKLVVTYGGMKE